MARTQEQIGQIGESFFNYICATNEITATEPGLDKYGWDFFVEFKTKLDKNIPLDLQNDKIQAKVQIKAFDTNIGYVQIKLSKMFDLVKFEMPAFICFMDLNGKNEPDNIYFVHIDKTIIKKVLKAVRKKQVSNQDLNKAKISIRFNKKDIINKPYKLDDEILKHIPQTIGDYVANKKNLRETIGYEDNEGKLNMSMVFDSNVIKDYVKNHAYQQDAPKIPVKIKNIMDTRFNMPLPFESKETQMMMNSSDLTVKFDPVSIGEMVFSFKKHEFSKPLVYRMQIINSLVNQFVTTDQKTVFFKDNFSSWELSFLNNKGKYDFKYSLDDNKTYNLKLLLHSLKLFKFIVENKGNEIILEHKKNDKVILSTKTELNFIGCEYYYNLFLVCDLFKNILVQNDYDISEVNINIDYIKNHQDIFKNLYDLYNSNFNVKEFSAGIKIEEKTKFPEKIKLLLPISFKFQQNIIGMFLLVYSNVEYDADNLIKFTGYDMEEIDRFCIEESKGVAYLKAKREEVTNLLAHKKEHQILASTSMQFEDSVDLISLNI